MTAASDTTRAKAIDLLSSGRVTVVQADDTTGLFVASVVGDSGRRLVFRDSHGGAWHCDCPAGAYGRACAHILSVSLIAGLAMPPQRLRSEQAPRQYHSTPETPSRSPAASEPQKRTPVLQDGGCLE